ncbi:hypothetical protein XENTR_v10024179 [Xenopus tropicalis]|nr:hypothetical protein XENTR_v10024179 [Xenopus tropicalis]
MYYLSGIYNCIVMFYWLPLGGFLCKRISCYPPIVFSIIYINSFYVSFHVPTLLDNSLYCSITLPQIKLKTAFCCTQ